MFSEEESHRFPPSRPWDHAIELKEGAPEAINCKIIATTREEDGTARHRPTAEGVALKEENSHTRAAMADGYIRM